MKRTGREGAAPNVSEHAAGGAPKRVRCARVPLKAGLIAAALLSGCARGPEFYAPPAHQYQHGFKAGGLKPWIAMNDPLAPAHLAEGVSPLEGDRHRWVESKAIMKFDLAVTNELRFSTDLSAPAATVLVLLVNGHEVDRVRYDAAGERRYEKAIDRSILRAGENSATLETDRRIALFNAGFVE